MNPRAFLAGERPCRRRTHPPCLRYLCGFALVLAIGASAEPAAPSVRPAWVGTPLERLAPAELETMYLLCNRLAMTTILSAGVAAQCSMVYEAYKDRVFGGDFLRLLDWYRLRHAADSSW